MRLVDADAFKKILSEHEMKHDKRRSFDDYDCGAANAYEHASDLLDEMPTIEPDMDFAKWVTNVIFFNEIEDFDFELFSELACRKLEKLGLVKKTESEWMQNENRLDRR